MLISALMIVKDEAVVIAAALRSLTARPDLIGEIVVVDTGSRDGTQDLCAKAGCRVVSAPWQDDFSLARNVALGAARSRYCLMIDADEEVDPDSWAGLPAFLAGPAPLGRVWVVSPAKDGVVREPLTRFCPNDPRYRYVGRVHEQLVGPGPRGDTGLRLLHSGYTPSALARKGTAARNLALLRAELVAQPDDPYLHYQIARTLFPEDPAAAIPHFLAASARAPEDAPYLPSLWRELGHALKNAGRPREALEVVTQALLRLPEFTDLYFLLGLIYLDLGQAEAMLGAFQTCLRLGEVPHLSTVEGVGSYRAHHNLGLFHELSGNKDAARHHYTAALTVRPDFDPASARLAAL